MTSFLIKCSLYRTTATLYLTIVILYFIIANNCCVLHRELWCVCKSVLWNWKLSQRLRISVWFADLVCGSGCLSVRFQKCVTSKDFVCKQLKKLIFHNCCKLYYIIATISHNCNFISQNCDFISHSCDCISYGYSFMFKNCDYISIVTLSFSIISHDCHFISHKRYLNGFMPCTSLYLNCNF